jgi:glucose-1-phosphatase
MEKSVDAVIFDLGGVLLNLDYSLTEKAFIDLGIEDFASIYSQLNQTNLFDQFEIGKVSPFHFVNRLLDKLPAGRNANQVVHAWNAMILDFPKERMEWLEEFGKTKRIFLLSNTNDLHVTAVRAALTKSVGHGDLERYFEKTYFSCAMGSRKPNVECFGQVIRENNIIPERTLFIDDSPQHIEGAKQAGLQTFFLERGKDVIEIFK